MNNFNEKIIKIRELLESNDNILIGAGAGLTLSAGLDDSGDIFKDNFKDFIDEYHFNSMYEGGFYPFTTPEERWAYFARYFVTYMSQEATELYKNLFETVKDKNYFVISTNADEQFEKSGFDESRIFNVQGDFRNLQCEGPCHDKLYDSTELFKQMVDETENRKIPSELLPKCPKCGLSMDVHLRKDALFVEDEHFHNQSNAYHDFLTQNEDENLLLLEMGVGFNTPTIIRFPFEQFTMENPNWNLIRFNRSYPGLVIQRGWKHEFINEWDEIKALNLKNDFQNRFVPVLEDINLVLKEVLK